MISENPNKSYHEVLMNPVNKMFFDIETSDEILESDIRIELTNLIGLLHI